MIRFDMSEFQESHSVSKLVEAPASYVATKMQANSQILCEKNFTLFCSLMSLKKRIGTSRPFCFERLMP